MILKKNAEQIKDCITKNNRQIQGVDDMPYLIAIGMDFPLDLNKEYGAILGMYHEDNATIPVKAFFGDFLKRPVRRKDYPPALLDKRVNLDQLLAINNAMKYPLSYVQGPPGTGKTNTILNTILTAFSMGVRFCLHRLTTIRLTGFSTVCRDCHIKTRRFLFRWYGLEIRKRFVRPCVLCGSYMKKHVLSIFLTRP